MNALQRALASVLRLVRRDDALTQAYARGLADGRAKEKAWWLATSAQIAAERSAKREHL